MTNKQQYVFLVDSDPHMHEALSALLRSVNLAMKGFFTAQEFLEKYDANVSGCLLLEVRLPGMSGLDLQQHLLQKGIALPIIIVTGYADIPMTVRAIKAGALDVIEKPFNEQILLDRIHQGLQEDLRRQTYQEEVAETVERMKTLTPRERQVLEMMASGKPNKQIAEDLGISRKTLDIHRCKVLQKMEAQGVADLVRMVLQKRERGITPREYSLFPD